MLKWEKLHKDGREVLSIERENCSAWVYPKSGGFVADFILIPNIEGNIESAFPNEAQAKDWCELLLLRNAKDERDK